MYGYVICRKEEYMTRKVLDFEEKEKEDKPLFET